MQPNVFFLTGGTGLVGRAVLGRLLRAGSHDRAYVLVRDPARLDSTVRSLGLPADRITLLQGDVRVPGLGLGGAERRLLRNEVTCTIHLAADTVFSRPLEAARETNVAGTHHLLDLAARWRGPLFLVSTAFVAGRRTGVVLERDRGGELGWVNPYEQSKWEAEQLVRASARDFAILRSSTIVCDTPVGEVTQYNAVHRALRLFHAGLAPMLPGRESAAVDLVPADYVADAITRLAVRGEASGETYHLCAGAGAIPLGEMLDRTHRFWSRDGEWRRRSIARPALTDLPTYRLFEESVDEVGDIRLRQVTRSLSHFVPQLALEKRFDTARADAVLGASAPPVHEYWERMLGHLLEHHWSGAPGPIAHRAA